ncbi:MAG TPA: family 16 glycoside hydrolase [Cyclobacteriaceae bacterium]|nr:family 16 glycoside hydrolase [Cyclobacteriaceae bacterium]
MKNLIITSLLVAIVISNGLGQSLDLVKALKDKKIKVYEENKVSVSDETRHSIGLTGTIVWLTDVTFTEGTIEIDLKGNDKMQQTFPGVIFHGVDSVTYDGVYFRPFNFQSADPVRKIHAVQYISQPEHPWNELRENQNGKYEKAVTPAPGPNDWFHATIVVKGKDINVYVNGSKTPSLTVQKLNDRTKGRFGLMCDGSIPGEFANLVIKK